MLVIVLGEQFQEVDSKLRGQRERTHARQTLNRLWSGIIFTSRVTLKLRSDKLTLSDRYIASSYSSFVEPPRTHNWTNCWVVYVMISRDLNIQWLVANRMVLSFYVFMCARLCRPAVETSSFRVNCTYAVAYLECVKGGGPGGLGDEVPHLPQKLTLFCYWMPKFWCFRRKKSVKQ